MPGAEKRKEGPEPRTEGAAWSPEEVDQELGLEGLLPFSEPFRQRLATAPALSDNGCRTLRMRTMGRRFLEARGWI